MRRLGRIPPAGPHESPDASGNLRGILTMAGSMAFFVSGDALIKSVMGNLPLGEIFAIRGLVSTTIMLGVVVYLGYLSHLPALASGKLGWRLLADIGATQFFFTGLTSMAFADAAAIGQSAPLAVTAGAAIFLGEAVGWRRWLATVAGLVGVLIIIRPGTSAFNWAALLIVASVLCVVARDLITRSLNASLPTVLIAWTTVTSVGLSGLARFPIETWTLPTVDVAARLSAAAALNCCGYYCAVVAMRSGEISAVGPFRYVGILIAVGIGYFAFGEVPDLATALGVAVVIGAGLYTLHRERVRAREREAREALEERTP